MSSSKIKAFCLFLSVKLDDILNCTVPNIMNLIFTSVTVILRYILKAYPKFLLHSYMSVISIPIKCRVLLK
jgi:hypothetical protein